MEIKYGLEEAVYTYKPVHDSNFDYSYDITSKTFEEPTNLIGQIGGIFKMIGRAFSKK